MENIRVIRRAPHVLSAVCMSEGPLRTLQSRIGAGCKHCSRLGAVSEEQFAPGECGTVLELQKIKAGPER